MARVYYAGFSGLKHARFLSAGRQVFFLGSVIYKAFFCSFAFRVKLMLRDDIRLWTQVLNLK